jgi:hypothetical protein
LLFRAPNRILIWISFITHQALYIWHEREARRRPLWHAYLSEVGSIMLIKTLTLHSLTYLVGITSSMAVHQVIPSPGAAKRFVSATVTGTTAQQIANRSIKSDKLPIKRAKPQLNDKAPAQAPAQITPNPKLKTDCKPPIDVPGRCFADARVNHKVAWSAPGTSRNFAETQSPVAIGVRRA